VRGALVLRRGRHHLSGRVDAGRNPFRKPHVVVAMLRQRRRCVFSCQKLLPGVLAHGLQQSIPTIRPFSIGHVYERLVNQLAEICERRRSVVDEVANHVAWLLHMPRFSGANRDANTGLVTVYRASRRGGGSP
jgi:hypothetical protein